MQFFIEVDLVHYTAITPITLCLWQVLRILFGKAFDIFGGKMCNIASLKSTRVQCRNARLDRFSIFNFFGDGMTS